MGFWKKGVIFVDELWTAPEFRRKGVAKELMKKAVECQEKYRAAEIRLYTEEDNEAAQAQFEKVWNAHYREGSIHAV